MKSTIMKKIDVLNSKKTFLGLGGQLSNEIRRLKSKVDTAKSNLDRYECLAETGAVSESQPLNYKNAYANALKEYDSNVDEYDNYQST